MKKIFLILFSLSVILILAISGCRIDLKSFLINEAIKEKQEIIKSLDASEEPDRELFKEYFSHLKLGDINILPISETYLECWFNKKEEFEFVYTVFNPKNGEFVKRCTNYTSSEGSDGMVMEALEWTFLSPGDYEYRIYVEDTLVKAMPFKVISYTEYFKQKL
jgi:hypothetical protein